MIRPVASNCGAETVSVVIPTVNRPLDVVAAVTSALEQTHEPQEVIVVLDGADTRAVQGVEDLRDRRVRVVRTPPHGRDAGATARNLGVREAVGQWIAFLDDDDTWMPQKLEVQLAASSLHAGAAALVIAGRTERRSADGSDIWPRRTIGPGERIGDYLFVRNSPGEGWLPTPTLMTTRSLALAVPFEEGLQQHEDLDWLLRLEAAGAKFVVVPEVVAVVNVGVAGTSLSATATWANSLEWVQQRKGMLGDTAFSAFCLTEVGRHARAAIALDSVPIILRVAFTGRPRVRDLAQFCAKWLVPRRFQQFVSTARRSTRRR